MGWSSPGLSYLLGEPGPSHPHGALARRIHDYLWGQVLEVIAIVTLGNGERYDQERLAREPWALAGALMVAIRV